MDVSSPRPTAVAQCETPSRPMQSTCEDYDSSSESEGESRSRRRNNPWSPNVAARKSYSPSVGATKTVNFKQDDHSEYSSHTAATTFVADSASIFNDAKSISGSSKYSKDSGYQSDPDAIHPGIVSLQSCIETDGGDDIRLRVDDSAPLALQFGEGMEGRALTIHPAGGGMADIVVSDNRRGRREKMYSLSPRKPLQTSSSISRSQLKERRKEKVERCTDPTCIDYGLNAPSTRPQQYHTGSRSSAIAQPAKSASRRSSSMERVRHRPVSYHYQPALNYWAPNMPPHPQYGYRGPPLSASAFVHHHAAYSTDYPGLNVWPPSHLFPMQRSPYQPAPHVIPPYEHFVPPGSQISPPTRDRRPVAIVHQSSQTPSARYSSPVITSNSHYSSDPSESASSDDEWRNYTLMPPPKGRPSLNKSLATTIGQHPAQRTRRRSSNSGYKSGSQDEREHKISGRRHSHRSAVYQTGLGEPDHRLTEARKRAAFEREASDRSDCEEQQKRRLSVTESDDSAKKPKDLAQEGERLRAQIIVESRHMEEAKDERGRKRAEREEQRNLEKAERERRRHRKLVENPQHQIPRSGDADLSKPSTPLRTNPVKRSQKPAKQNQNLYTAPLALTTIVDTKFQDLLGANARSECPRRANVSAERQQSLSSLDKPGEDTGKTFEPPRHLQSNPLYPILPSQTGDIVTDDQTLEAPRAQADTYGYDISLRAVAITSSPKQSSITFSSSTLPNDLIEGLEHDSGDLGTSHSTKSAEGSQGAERLANISRPERIEQVESSSSPANTTLEIMTRTTRDVPPNIQAIASSAKNLVLLPKPSKSGILEVSSVVNLSSTTNEATSRTDSSGDSSTGDAEKPEHYNFVMDADSDEAFEIDVKSALDTAMNVVRGLLLRELLDYALLEATESLGGLSSSSSASHVGSTGSSGSSNLSSSTSKSQNPQSRKRMRGNGRDPGDGDGSDSDDGDRPKKQNEKGSPDRPPHRRLKCPFYQRQPEKYTKAACRGEGFADMAKLKDHIKRVHTQPLRCSRCWMEMKSDDAYSEHVQQEDICKKKPEPQEDRIRPQMLKRLDFKKAPYANARNVEEKWNMLFSVLFPNDSNIPSPYELQGMSPRLERALSEALEAELTRELAPVLEPIMSRIKALIPAIVENCRLKLMHTSPSSDDETVFTPSAVSSGAASSDSEPGSSNKQAKHRSSPTASQCTGSSFEVVPIPDVSSKVQGKRLQQPAPSTSDIGLEGRQEVSSPESSTDFRLFYPDAPREMQCLHKSNVEDSFDIGDDSGLFAFSGGFPSDGTPPATEDRSTISSNTPKIVTGPYNLVEDLTQHSDAYQPSSQLSTWLLPGAAWDNESGLHEQLRGKQQGVTIPRDQGLPSEWDLMMNEFDFSQFSDR